MANQCAAGHEGNLCGKCSMGFAQKMSAIIGRCQPCASTTSIISMYVLAAVACMAFIRLMCFFNSKPSGSIWTAGGDCCVPPETKQGVGSVESDPDVETEPGMPQDKDQLSKDPVVQPDASGPLKAAHCALCGEACAGCARASAPATVQGAAVADKTPVGDLLKPFTIYLQASVW